MDIEGFGNQNLDRGQSGEFRLLRMKMVSRDEVRNSWIAWLCFTEFVRVLAHAEGFRNSFTSQERSVALLRAR